MANRRKHPPKFEVQESEQDLRRLLRRERCHSAHRKLQVLLLYRQGKALSLTHAAQKVGADRHTVARWQKTYRESGLEALLISGRSHQKLSARPSGLTPALWQVLLEKTDQPGGGFQSFIDAWRWLAAEHGLVMGYPAFHRLARRHGLRLKVPRPQNRSQDTAQAAEFKKSGPAGGRAGRWAAL